MQILQKKVALLVAIFCAVYRTGGQKSCNALWSLNLAKNRAELQLFSSLINSLTELFFSSLSQKKTKSRSCSRYKWPIFLVIRDKETYRSLNRDSSLLYSLFRLRLGYFHPSTVACRVVTRLTAFQSYGKTPLKRGCFLWSDFTNSFY